MTEQEALEKAITAAGGQESLGKHLGVSRAVVSMWKQKGRRVPPEYVLRIERVTGISRHDLREDIYPRTGSV